MIASNIPKKLERITKKPWEFLTVFLVIFFLMAVALFIVDFVPEPVTVDSSHDSQTPVVQNYPSEDPVRIVVHKVGIDTQIENPVSTDITVLDDALYKGAVRYPESGLLGDNSTVYLFGHQSGLPVVKNKAFKAFNGIQNLEAGDEITVYSATAVYTYRVASVEKVNAETALIPLNSGSRTLTLSTCNSFGQKSERFVVTSDFVSRVPLTNTAYNN